MPAPRDPRHFSSAEVAAILGVSKVTLKFWLRTGRIPEPKRNPNNQYRQWTMQDISAVRAILQEKR